MIEAAAIVSASTVQSLVLMDESGRGTYTYDGLARAWSIAHRLLTHNQALTLFATHYFEIARLPGCATGAANVHLAAAESSSGIVFLHEVKAGPASRSYGIPVAQDRKSVGSGKSASVRVDLGGGRCFTTKTKK